MKSFLIGIIYRAALSYFDAKFFARVESLVLDLLNADVPGDEKRERVRDAIHAEWDYVKNSAIDTAIQIILLHERKA